MLRPSTAAAIEREVPLLDNETNPFRREQKNLNIWSDATIRNVKRSHRLWINWLGAQSEELLSLPVLERLSVERIEAYLDHLSSNQLTEHTIGAYVYDLYMAANRLAPNEDWGWLQAIGVSIRRSARRSKPIRTVDPKALFTVGLQFMDEARGNGLNFKSAVQFRNGLICAFLACRPLRPKNLRHLEIGQSFIKANNGFRVQLRGDEMKGGSSFDFDLPVSLNAQVTLYLESYRTLIPGADEHTWLFPSTRRQLLSESALHRIVVAITSEQLGRRISPHQVRHSAATAVARAMPKKVGITRSILGHKNLDTSQQYYNLARVTEASTRYQDTVARMLAATSTDQPSGKRKR